MKQFVALICIFHLVACASITRPHTRATIAFGQIISECSNLDVIVLDDHSMPLPGVSVAIRSASDNSLIWQGVTATDGHIQQQVKVTDLIVSADIEGFYSHQERINIPSGKKCLVLIYTKPDPRVTFKVT